MLIFRNDFNPRSEITHIDGRSIQKFGKRFIDERERGFSVGRFATTKFYGDLETTVSLTLRESEEQEEYDVDLTYQKIEYDDFKKQFNLPASVVQFEHYEIDDDLYYLSSNIFVAHTRSN